MVLLVLVVFGGWAVFRYMQGIRQTARYLEDQRHAYDVLLSEANIQLHEEERQE